MIEYVAGIILAIVLCAVAVVLVLAGVTVLVASIIETAIHFTRNDRNYRGKRCGVKPWL